ncbi:MAG TPA: DUF2092 domain-containing protein [Vicinamibacterales bacterium]
MKLTVLMLSLCVATVMAQAPSVERSYAAGRDAPIDDRAIVTLARMTDFLKMLNTFRISSESSRDEIVDTDMKVQKNASNVMSVRLPDRLHAHVRGDDRDLEFFYNGRTLTVFSHEKNYYASTPAPPTISRTLDATRARHGIVMPLADFIQMAAGEDFKQSIVGAGHIGTSRIDGVECDHLAIRQADVDWQVWIEKGATPLPRKLVITTKNQPTQPQYVATLEWDLSPGIDDSLFTFVPPPNAVRIMFARTKNRDESPANP